MSKVNSNNKIKFSVITISGVRREQDVHILYRYLCEVERLFLVDPQLNRNVSDAGL